MTALTILLFRGLGRWWDGGSGKWLSAVSTPSRSLKTVVLLKAVWTLEALLKVSQGSNINN